MSERCKCGRLVHAGDKCRVCWLIATDPRYAAALPNGPAAVAVPITAERWPCLHRGPQIDTRECQTCGSRGKIEPVYECAANGRCMMRPWRVEGEEGIAICLRCDERAIPEELTAEPLDTLATQ